MQISELKLAKDLIRKPSVTPKDAGAIKLLAKNLIAPESIGVILGNEIRSLDKASSLINRI